MSEPPQDLAAAALRHPERLATLTLAQWSLLIRQARQAGVLARIAWWCDEQRLDATLAEPVAAHLQSARRLAAAQQFEMAREVRHIQAALARTGLPLILLKGAAYLMRGLAANRGRAFSDVDILVPKDRLPEVESALMLQGWMSTHLTPYDQRYYREWMHELPPMEHLRRLSLLDVHHTILPETARLRPDAAKLRRNAEAVPGMAGILTLSRADMVLHSMTHLFHNDDLSHGLRDLSDLDLLLRQFGTSEGFWSELVERSIEMDLARPLHYGLRYTQRILGTPVPAEAQAAAANAGPSGPRAALMDTLWDRALASHHPRAARPGSALALFALYVRAHWLRMPPGLLVRHLTVKALRRAEPDKSKKPAK